MENKVEGKRTWVLLRGLARESRHWGSFVSDLSERFPSDQVLPLDLPGAGEFKDVAPFYSVESTVDFLKAELDTKTPGAKNVHLLALSFGGMVALSWAYQYPNQIKKLVILNSSSRLSPFYQRLRWESWRDFAWNAVQADPKAREEGILNLVVNSVEQRKAQLPSWIKIANERSIPPKTALAQLAAATRFRVPKCDLSQKALFLVALGDRLVEPACSIELADYFSSPIKKHPWGGHDLTTDDSRWVLDQVDNWLKSPRHAELDAAP
jgi:pimeloyl-ACP methyl ester carboxylesterase